MVSISIPPEYPYILAAFSANFLLYVILVPIFLMPGKRQAFTPEFMSQFDDEHDAVFPGQKPDKMGLPDMGNGWYGSRLPFKNWFKLAVNQRVLGNYIESMPGIVIPAAIAGLFFGKIVIWTAWLILVGRIAYSFGYRINPQFRFIGFIVIMLSQWTNMFLAVASSVLLLQQQ